jgi:hypothetical protein
MPKTSTWKDTVRDLSEALASVAAGLSAAGLRTQVDDIVYFVGKANGCIDKVKP